MLFNKEGFKQPSIWYLLNILNQSPKDPKGQLYKGSCTQDQVFTGILISRDQVYMGQLYTGSALAPLAATRENSKREIEQRLATAKNFQ